MQAKTIAVDLGKNVFEIAMADESWRVTERHRLSRARFGRFFVDRPGCRVVMESCGTAHFWARRIRAAGHEVALLPAQYVRAYVRRNKTDRADASALIEAFRCADIQPVPVKSVEQQQIQALHRVGSQWMQTRCSRINTMRGVLREFGIAIPLGPSMAKTRVAEALEDAENELPAGLRGSIAEMLQETTELEARMLEWRCNCASSHAATMSLASCRPCPVSAYLTPRPFEQLSSTSSAFRRVATSPRGSA